MICLRSGYCCIQLDVVIVDDPDLGIVEGNLKHKPGGEKCQHLVGAAGKHSCAVHDRGWYKDTPCHEYGQVERGNTPCRIGEHILNNK